MGRMANEICRALVKLFKSDFANGLAAEDLRILRGNEDASLMRLAQCEASLPLETRSEAVRA